MSKDVFRVFPETVASAVKPKTACFQAIEESGYRPNLLARSLRTENHADTGLVVTNTFITASISQRTAVSYRAGWRKIKGASCYWLTVCYKAEEERQAIQYLFDLRCDAIMIYPRFQRG